ncbi:MAG: response regulator [Chlorobi bacterium]|nr:response regulator [Chlorobiota bacterium]
MKLRLKRFSDYSVRAKLFLITMLAFVSIVIMAIGANCLLNATRALSIISNIEKVHLKNFDLGVQEFYRYVLLGDKDKLKNSLAIIDEANNAAFVFSKIDSLAKTMNEKDFANFLFTTYKEGVNYDIKNAETLAKQIKTLLWIIPAKIGEIQHVAWQGFIKGGEISTLILQIGNSGISNEKIDALHSNVDIMHGLSLKLSATINEFNNYIKHLFILSLLVLAIVLGVGTVLLSYLISRSISLPIKELTEKFKNIAKGNLDSSVSFKSNNEIGELSQASREIQAEYQNIISYCNNVADGNYSLKIQPKSEADELSIALNTMAEKLKQSKDNTEKDNWLKNGLVEMSKQIMGDLSVTELCDRTLNFLTQFLNVELGAIYVYNREEDRLELTSSFGINIEGVQKYVKIGEGLIGEAAKTRNFAKIRTKGKYNKIFSATGEIVPQQVYMVPLEFNNKLVGVIELAPINELSDLKSDFIKSATARLAVNISAALSRSRQQELLKKTQEQSNELKLQQEKLEKRIKENEQMQISLEWEKSLLDALLNYSPDAIYFKDLKSRFIKISKSMVDLFGVKQPEEVEGKTDFDFHSEEHAREAYEDEQRIIKTKKPVIGIVEKEVFDGKTRYVSTTKMPLYNKKGEVLGTFGISRDITEIKQMEANLEWERLLLNSLLDTIPDSIYFKDRESRFIKVSKSMVDLFGVKRKEEVEGKTDFDFQSEEHAKKAFEDEQKIIKTKKPVIGIVEKTIFDGKARYVSTTKMPLYNKKGEVLGTFGISRNITAIKELENEIKQHNEKLQEQQERLQAANEELKTQEEELKVSNEELKSQEEELRVANEELEEQTKVLIENEKNLQIQQEELRVANEELEERSHQLELQKKEIVKNNNELLKTQNYLQVKARELEKTSQYKSEFLANMSHELRTPLNSLLILSKILSENKKGNLTEQQVNSIKIIYKSGTDLLQLINEILDLSKIEAGKMSIEYTPVKTEDLITEINLYFQPVAEEKKLSLKIEQGQQFPEILYTDQQRLMQILRNLLSNAFKFTSSGGITVSFMIPEPGTVFANPDLNIKNTYQISVRDTGVGIAKDKKDAIFNAFQQADGSISRKFGGTGLGLSISKELTRLLGGEIQVDSVEGKGSAFTIFLPLNTEKYHAGKPVKATVAKEVKTLYEPSAQVAPEGNNQNKKAKDAPVYIKDDRGINSEEPFILIICPGKDKAQKLLVQCNSRGYKAVVAENIANGVLLAEHFKPSAIILSADLNTPQNNELLKKNKWTFKLPVHPVSKIDDEVFLTSLKEISNLSITRREKGQNKGGEKQAAVKNILIVEDDAATLEALHLALDGQDFDIHDAVNGQQAFELIKSQKFDCVVLDLGLPDISGKELLQKLKSEKIKIPNIIIYTAKALTQNELRTLHKFTNSIVIKGLKSEERLMDEITLFLHQVSGSLKRGKLLNTKDNEPENNFAGKKILVVDDDIRNIFALGQILEEKEIEVFEAENGLVALEVLKNNPGIDLVLMDLMMPEMDGIEAMKAIRKTPGISEIPIITITAKAMKEDYNESIKNGANDYISKPVDEAKLFSLLKIWLLNK